MIAFFLITSIQVSGQVKGEDSLTIEQEMLKKGAMELKLTSEKFRNAMIAGTLGATVLGLSSIVTEENKNTFNFIGGVLTFAGIVQIIKIPIHLKRSSMYFEASATGVRITF